MNANNVIACPQCGATFRYWEGYNAGINADMSSTRVCSKACMRARLPQVQSDELRPLLHLAVPMPDGDPTNGLKQPTVELDNSTDSEYNSIAQ